MDVPKKYIGMKQSRIWQKPRRRDLTSLMWMHMLRCRCNSLGDVPIIVNFATSGKCSEVRQELKHPTSLSMKWNVYTIQVSEVLYL